MSHALDAFLGESQGSAAADHLAETLGCLGRAAAAENLLVLRGLGIASDLIADFLRQLERWLPETPNPDRGLANCVRYIQAARSPQALLSLFERDSQALPILLRILATSQHWAEQLIRDPECFDFLRLTEGLPVSRGILVDELTAEIAGSGDPTLIGRSLRTHKSRETMRIEYGDFIGALPLETVGSQLSILAGAILEVALEAALREAIARFGTPLRPDGLPARIAVIGYGQLGGHELSYSPRLDVLFISDEIDQVRGPRGGVSGDYFERVARRVLQWVSEDSVDSAQYHLVSDIRPAGSQGHWVATLEQAIRYYENQGQTWQRQAFIKARGIAGDQALATEFLSALEPWVYRRYLNRADIGEIAALQRKLEKRVTDGGSVGPSVSNQPGGVRDIEFLIQYLQLLHGGELAEVRTANTLEAISALQRVGCLTAQERSVLEENYRFLRRLEHHLQMVLGASAESLPERDPDLRQFLLATGFRSAAGLPDQTALYAELRQRTALNLRILNHLLSQTFSAETTEVAPETDLVLEPDPPAELIESLLAKYGFHDPAAAYRQLIELGREEFSFLSSRRCRHFLSAIAPRLLQAIAGSPSPDQTLINLGRVSSSLGGKTVLWELFQASPPALDLCVRLCTSSSYLVSILTGNPGMIDELIDSLMLDRLPSTQQIESALADLCRGVEDPTPVLHSFKNSMHLLIGVRDILGKDPIERTHRALADVAEACLKQVIEHEYHRLIQKLGVPIVGSGPHAGQPAELVVLGLGKLGGREPNYHSDLEVLFLFDEEGATRALLPHRRHESISNRQFFNQLGQRVVKSLTRVGPTGHLYELDARLRPLGGGVGSAVSIDDLQSTFCQGSAQLWERQALCQARIIWANPTIEPRVQEALRAMLTSLEWRPEMAADIQRHRHKLEHGASPGNIKRSPGGTLDIEFIVQMKQVRHAQADSSVLVPGTLEALQQLERGGWLTQESATILRRNYRWLRSVESGLRLMNLPARHDLPTSLDQLSQLRNLLRLRAEQASWSVDFQDGPADVARSSLPGSASTSAVAALAATHPLSQMWQQVRQQNRQIFSEIFAER